MIPVYSGGQWERKVASGSGFGPGPGPGLGSEIGSAVQYGGGRKLESVFAK